MRELLKQYLLEAVKDALYKQVTKENLKAILQFIVDKLAQESLKTENQVDDWIVSLVASWINDANVTKIYDFLSNCIGIGEDGKVYFAGVHYNSANANAILAEQIAPNGKEFASPTLYQIYTILDMIIPILYSWYNQKVQ